MKRKKPPLRDPVCMKRMNKNKAYVKIKYKEEYYYLCCPLCQSTFANNPKYYAERYKEINI